MTEKKKKKKNYINNKDMLVEVKTSLEQGYMTEKLGKMMMLLTKRYSSQGCYSGYTYVDDMESYALMTVCKAWKSFNPEKSDNPFAYFTQTIKRAFWQYLEQEEKSRDIRDEMMMSRGELPSHTYVNKYISKMFSKEYQNSIEAGEPTDGFYSLVNKLCRQLIPNESGMRDKVSQQLMDEMLNMEFEKNETPYQKFYTRINEILESEDPSYKVLIDENNLKKYQDGDNQ